jgi:hypothetical protein
MPLIASLALPNREKEEFPDGFFCRKWKQNFLFGHEEKVLDVIISCSIDRLGVPFFAACG